MGNTVSALAPNCRVFILVDDVLQSDYNLNPQKSFYKLNSILKVNSTISVEGGGSATILLNDKDMKFRKYFPFKYLNTRTFGDEKIEPRSDDEAKSDLERDPLPVALTNAQEIEAYRTLLKKYGKKHSALEAVAILSTGGKEGGKENASDHGGLILPLFTTQNLIWIDYLGRDGYWYRKFSGIITKVEDSKTTRKTPEITLQCRTYERMLEYSYIVTGLNNLGGIKPSEIPSLKNQKATLSTINKYAGKYFHEIIIDVFRTANQFFIKDRLENGKDYRYFKVKDIFGFGNDIKKNEIVGEPKDNLELNVLGNNGVPNNIQKKLVGNWNYSRITGSYYLEDGTFVYNDKGKSEKEVLEENDTSNKDEKNNKQDGEEGYPIYHKLFKLKKFHFKDALDVNKDFYPGSEVIRDGKKVSNEEVREWIPVLMTDDFFGNKKPFQNLVRTSLTLFNVDKSTPAEILKELKSIVLAYIYFDGDGTVKIERPYFDIDVSMMSNNPEEQAELVPPDFDIRYVITQKDRSYVSDNWSESESQIVTRVEVQSNSNFVNFDNNLQNILKGYSNSSFKTISKFGERIVTPKPIVTQGFSKSDFAKQILDSYCYAQKLLLTSDSKMLSLILDQRPDLQLNRPMLLLDRGVVTLITELSESFDFSRNSHTTSVKGKYTRFVGEMLFNPWRKIVKRDGQSHSGWLLDDWPEVEPVDLSKVNNTLGIGRDVLDELGFNDNTETYQGIKEEMQEVLNNSNNSFEEDKYTCLIFRHDRKNVNGFDSYKSDVIYFTWKENGVEKFERFLGSGGDPQTQESRLKGTSYGEYAKLSNGVYRFVGAEENKYIDNKKKVTSFKCDDFNFVKLKKSSDGKFLDSTETFDSKNISQIKDINDVNQKLFTYLSSHSFGVYNKLDDSGQDKSTCYDSLQIEISPDKQTGGKGYVDIFLRNVASKQTYLDVIIKPISSFGTATPTNIADINSTEIDKLFLWLFNLNQGNWDRVNGDIKFKETPSFDNFKPNFKVNDRVGLYLVTRDFTGIEDDEEWIKFQNSVTKQIQWFQSKYKPLLVNLIFDTEYLVNGISLNERINLLIGEGDSLSSSTDLNGNVITIYNEVGPRIPDFPVDNVINTSTTIFTLLHLGFMEAMIDNPNKEAQQIFNNKKDDIIKYLKQYYLFNYWNRETLDKLKQDGQMSFNNINEQLQIFDLSYLKSIQINNKVLKGNIKVWELNRLIALTLNIENE